MKKRKCRLTPEERKIHDEAVKLRKMTDEQLVNKVRSLRNASSAVFASSTSNDKGGVEKLLEGLSRGECKGVKSATTYKISQYAREIGVL
jgi:hypothetical protein